MKRALLISAGFMLAAGIAAPTPGAWARTEFHPTGAAHAHRLAAPGALRAAVDQTQDFCSNLGYGYCMNDWNGNHNQGAPIKMYYGGSSNEQFELQPLNPCNSSPADEVTETCPFVVGSGLNAKYAGSLIFQLYYPDANKCIGTSSAGDGILTGCNNSSGSGGGDGTMLIGPYTSNNPIIDRYWTDQPPSNVVDYLCGTGFENPLALDVTSFTTACEWYA